MSDMLYLAMNGATQIMQAQTANNHNLANASTTGFREEFSQIRSMPIVGAGYPTSVYAVNDRPGTNLANGPLQQTGRELDVSVDGDGWIVVQAADGSEALTRAGDLRVSPEGLLVTGRGQPVMGYGGPIALPPHEKLDIAADGTVTIRPLGEAAASLAVVDRIKLANPPQDQIEKRVDGLMHVRGSFEVEPDAGVTLVKGALEGSNVNTVESMVTMIELSRQYEMQIKMMKLAIDNEASSAELMKIG